MRGAWDARIGKGPWIGGPPGRDGPIPFARTDLCKQKSPSIMAARLCPGPRRGDAR